MSAQTTGLPIACWRIKGDAAARLATGDWIDGTPDAETLKEYDRLGWSIEYAYCAEAVVELVEALRPRVAMTFEAARAADDRGESPIFCQCDALNPCWAPGMPITVPLRHWGYTPDMDGDGLACPDCRLRAALANISSAP